MYYLCRRKNVTHKNKIPCILIKNASACLAKT